MQFSTFSWVFMLILTHRRKNLRLGTISSITNISWAPTMYHALPCMRGSYKQKESRPLHLCLRKASRKFSARRSHWVNKSGTLIKLIHSMVCHACCKILYKKLPSLVCVFLSVKWDNQYHCNILIGRITQYI